MAEIILEPTVQSKVIPLSIRLNDTDTSLVSQLVTNRQFSTADTDAWFSFTLEGLASMTGTFDLTLINLHDKSVFNHTDKVFNTNPFYYKLDSGTDELTNEIRHAGKWVGQLVVTLANGDSATRKFIFGIEGHILDGTVVQTILLEDYNALIASIESAKDELTQYNIDYSTLISTVESQEAARVQAELTREQTFNALVDSEIIAQNVATELQNVEATFAPRMLSLERELAEAVHVIPGLDKTATTDMTATIQAKLDAIAIGGGGTLRLPSGHYKINSLNIPKGVSVEGDYSFDSYSSLRGTVLYCVDTVNPAIKLNTATSIKNVAFYYPNQFWDATNVAPGIAYPASIYTVLDSVRLKIENVFFVNTYFAIDADRRHEILVINNVQGYAISKGLVVDHSSDVDRFVTVHFNYNVLKNTGWYANFNEFGTWTRKNGIAFTFKRIDWGVVNDCFAWGYRKGYLITTSVSGRVGGLHINKSGADACGMCISMLDGYAVHITDCYFTHFNQFVANVDTDPYAIHVEGGTDVMISGCTFWGCDKHVIRINCDNSRIIGNNFRDYGKTAALNNTDYRAILLDIGNHVLVGNVFDGNLVARVFGILINSGASSVVIGDNAFSDYITYCVQTSVPTDNIFIGVNSYKNCTNKVSVASNSQVTFADKNLTTSGSVNAASMSSVGNIDIGNGLGNDSPQLRFRSLSYSNACMDYLNGSVRLYKESDGTLLPLNVSNLSIGGYAKMSNMVATDAVNGSIFMDAGVLKFKDTTGTVKTITLT